MNYLQDFIDALLSTDALQAKKILLSALDQQPTHVLADSIILPALEYIGEGWEKGDYALSQVYMSGRICENMMGILFDIDNRLAVSIPNIAIVTLNDYHALGRQMVSTILAASGYFISNYGRMNIDELVEKIQSDNIELLLISVLMYSSAIDVAAVRNACIQKGITVKIAVGGAPFRLDRNLWKQVGADDVGYSAADAIRIVREHLGASNA